MRIVLHLNGVSMFANLLTGIYYLMFAVFPGKLFGILMSSLRLTWVFRCFHRHLRIQYWHRWASIHWSWRWIRLGYVG